MVKARRDIDVLKKSPTGIKGLDEITKGGLLKENLALFNQYVHS